MNHGSHVLSSISSSNLMTVLHISLYKLNDVFDEIFSQFLPFEVDCFVCNRSLTETVNLH